MPYTLWSQGRLLGESELEYADASPLWRSGAFWPTIVGSKVLRSNPLALELRGPDGGTVLTDAIEVRESPFLEDLTRRELELDDGPADVTHRVDARDELELPQELAAFDGGDDLSDEPLTAQLDPVEPDERRPPFALYSLHVRLHDRSARACRACPS